MMNDTTGVILLVEDNPEDEELTLRAFRRNRLLNPIVVARDGVEALDYLFRRNAHQGRSADEMPHLILLDLKLPKVDGLEVLAAIRQHEATRLTPVVILTTSNEEQDLVRSYALGANSFVRKPVDFAEFSEAIRQLGMYWLVLNQAARGSRGG